MEATAPALDVGAASARADRLSAIVDPTAPATATIAAIASSRRRRSHDPAAAALPGGRRPQRRRRRTGGGGGTQPPRRSAAHGQRLCPAAASAARAELARRRVAIRRVLGHRPLDDLVELRRQVRARARAPTARPYTCEPTASPARSRACTAAGPSSVSNSTQPSEYTSVRGSTVTPRSAPAPCSRRCPPTGRCASAR